MPSLTPQAYVNGRYLPLHEARVSLLDRGHLFADAIYEVAWIDKGRLIDFDLHWRRFEQSLHSVSMQSPYDAATWRLIMQELIARNSCMDGGLYWHMSRGVMMRDHLPRADMIPHAVAFVRHAPLLARSTDAITIATSSDMRWRRCDIKTVGLLPNVLARMAAAQDNKNEVWFVNEGGVITEGAACNAFIVDKNNVLRTHPSNHAILAGVVRNFVVEAAARLKIDCREEAFSVAEMKNAQEAFCTGTMQGILPVAAIDGHTISHGDKNGITARLQMAYEQHLAL